MGYGKLHFGICEFGLLADWYSLFVVWLWIEIILILCADSVFSRIAYGSFLLAIFARNYLFFKYKSWWHYCVADIKSRCLWNGCFKYSLASVQLSYIFFVFFSLIRLYWPQSRTVHIYVCPKGPSNMAAKLILLTSLTLEVVLVTFTVVAWQLQWSPKQWIVIPLMRALNRVWNSLGVGYLNIPSSL